MDDKLLDVLIEGLFGFRRGLLKQVADMDKAIEKLQTLKETGGIKVSPEVAEYIKTGDASGIVDDMGPDPDECDHKFVKGSCEKCGIFEEVVEEADKPDK